MTNLTEGTLKVFIRYAEDAGNWGGSPLIDDWKNPAVKGHLTDLKKKGLIFTEKSDGCLWLYFTEKGDALALEHGINIAINRW
ncbi:hypothetical protein UFOVP978_45 [uncultured Caudovirales phage]|uniref:Uncharacterized protein n=1 Tax=uncultured Caudovirales phage TaxID=2100421 RepID=A0A6J5PZN1_9CAUD|nr:hypothetical protein UFOVP978_45 [uncultured Caudovirales phage]